MTLYAADPAEPPKSESTESLEPDSNNNLAIAAAKESLCLILGSEGQGLSDNVYRSCDRVSIPMPGQFESLNVAVAGGILLYLLNNKIPMSKLLSYMLLLFETHIGFS